MSKRCVLYSVVICFALAASDGEARRRVRGAPASRAPRGLRIAILSDGPGKAAAKVRAKIQSEVQELTKGEYTVTFPAAKQTVADWKLATISAAAERLLSDAEVDLIIAVGPFSSHLLARRTTLPKPVIATQIFDPEAQGVPFAKGRSGVKNLTYLTTPNGVERAVGAFRKLVPFKHLAFVLDQRYIDLLAGFGSGLRARLAATGVKVSFLRADRPQAEFERAFPGSCDAVLLLPLPNEQPAAMDRLVGFTTARKLPSFTPAGRLVVERGVLAGFAAGDNLERLARRVALNVQRVLMREDLARFNVTISYGVPELTLNLTTANAIGYRPTWDVLSDVVLVGRKQSGRKMTKLGIYQAIREAVKANLDLLAGAKDVEAGVQEVRKAYARYLPSAGLNFTGVILDSDRGSGPTVPGRGSVNAALSISQTLWSEKALANISIQKQLQKGREQQLRELKLDIMEAAALYYLNLLATKTVERIQKENLKVTKKNLELARVRRSIGTTGLADVYRWEVQLATDKKAVINAIAARNQAEIALNRLRSRPQEEPLQTVEGDLLDYKSQRTGKRLDSYIKNPWSFSTMREFMVREGLQRSPALAQIDRAIAAKERALFSAKLDYFMPTLGFSFGLDHRFWASGETQAIPLGGQTLNLAQPDTTWSAVFGLSWNLLEGGAKLHTHRKLRTELSQLRLWRRAAAEKVEQGIRAAMHKAGASFPAIQLSQDAAVAATKSVALVTDAYAKGAAAITQLLDAQQAALNAHLGSAVAVFQFFIDFSSAQRRIANEGFFLFDRRDESTWFDRLDRYQKDHPTR
jgi:outer membrane protein